MRHLRNPIDVLKSLEEHAKNKEYKFERLYRNLYNPEFYMLAYKNIAKSQGSMTRGTDGMSLDDMTTARIDKIIMSLKDHTYHPNPARRTYIEKKSSKKKRPLGIPSTNDKLVQEIVHILLDAIYEPTFSDYSHGFRPKRSCHTALRQIESGFKAKKWIIEGDIQACFDSFDHHVLISILRERIKDEYFISLMWKLLKAGYMEQWTYYSTYSGTPQGSGCSPILANIYLSRLDEFMENYKANFDTGELENTKRRPQGKKYRNLTVNLSRQLQKYNKIKSMLTRPERKEKLKPILAMREQRLAEFTNSPMEGEFKRLSYNRYADDFLIGISGSKEECEKVKSDVGKFLKDELKLTMSEEKTKITNSSDLVRYLGYDITVRRSKSTMRDKNGILRRAWYGTVAFYVPKEKWVNKLREYKAFKVVKRDDGKEIWKPLHRGFLMNKQDIEILSHYNAEMRGTYNYYKLANNVTTLNCFRFIMENSMYKTFAAKYRTKSGKIRKKYEVDGVFGVNYMTKQGMKRREFYHDGFKRNTECIKDAQSLDTLPNYRKYTGVNTLAKRLNAGICEQCGIKTKDIHLHHVRTLKDLTGKTQCEQIMLSKRRKSIALCTECFSKTTSNL